jgi:hypothetical protein
MPHHFMESKMACTLSCVLRSRSVSSMRSTKVPFVRLAQSQL